MPVAVGIMGVCGLLVWLEDGWPIFFVQSRTGKRGRPFRMFKLRTMHKNAFEKKQELLDRNQLAWPDFKLTNDPRVTYVGHFLRVTSLDELPQLFNVLRGDMSLVGPRPTSFDVSTYALWQTERLEVTPGITGLWQVSGRSDVAFDERVRLDVEYIENLSLRQDLRILWRTVFAVMGKRGAY